MTFCVVLCLKLESFCRIFVEKKFVSVIHKVFKGADKVTYHKISIKDDPSQNLQRHFENSNKIIDERY